MNIKALASGAAGALAIAIVATAMAEPPRVTGNLPAPIDLGQTSQSNDSGNESNDSMGQSYSPGSASGSIAPVSGQTSTAPLPPAAWAGLIGLGVAGVAMRSARKKGYA